MTKPLDPDFRALKMIDKAMKISTPKMRKPHLDYVWDKYIKHPYPIKRNINNIII